MELGFYITIFIAGVFAAGINALAGGGPILTLGILSFAGIDPRIANLTSTVALSPGQLAAGWVVRGSLQTIRIGAPMLLIALALAGGAGGALLLLHTSSPAFGAIVPWLVLAATAIYAWSSIRKPPHRDRIDDRRGLLTALFAPLAVYGGYFGGGNSFLVLALLGVAGHEPKAAGKAKNALIAAINLGAVLVFVFSDVVDWPMVLALGAGGVLGSMIGLRLLEKMPVAAVRSIVIAFGLFCAAWMFAR